jgi:hypothetical protein
MTKTVVTRFIAILASLMISKPIRHETGHKSPDFASHGRVKLVHACGHG